MAEDPRTGTAMVFPGMSPCHFTDIGKFMLVNPFARKLVALADQRLGYSLIDRFRDAEGDYSEYAQVAFMVTCLALAEWAEEELGVVPGVCAGPSFGEKPAAVYAGALPFGEAVWMTAQLARCMEEFFAREYQDVVTQSFLRTPGDGLRAVLAELDGRGGWSDISCYIDDDIYMVSLREQNLDWLQRKVRGLGGMPLYTMRPPMHSSAFAALRRKAEDEVIGGLPFADPHLPVVADQDGTVVTTGEGFRAILLDSFVKPLRWPDVVSTLKRLGVQAICVAGPDRLFGRVRGTTGNFAVTAASPALALQPRRTRAAAS